MAGIALFGNLAHHLESGFPVLLKHRLESVQVLPKKDSNITENNPSYRIIMAIACVEPTPSRNRVYCLTSSSESGKKGEPTCFSAVLDALSFGMDLERPDEYGLVALEHPDSKANKLFVVSAGNIRKDYVSNHTELSDNSPIESPGQAWNVVTVGAYTELVDPSNNPGYKGWEPVAKCGALSPFSRTSVLFPKKHQNIKPDICMEGGNILTDGGILFDEGTPSLSITTTGKNHISHLTSANATSAATAQAARLAALAMERYPSYWPETIRGLLVHSAEWTQIMNDKINSKSGKRDKFTLLQRYGWGVPTEERVLNSTKQRVILVIQEEFIPFSSNYKIEGARLHDLPWPKDALKDLGEVEVRLRVTLSYFIEPSASRRGWRQKYSYASHGLRFDIPGPTETQKDFIARLAKESGASEESNTTKSSATNEWSIGIQQRNHGSLHQDDWFGTAIDLSQRNSIAVYPVGGWWKNNYRKDRKDFKIRYSLLLSISTVQQEVDLYTPIINKLKWPNVI